MANTHLQGKDGVSVTFLDYPIYSIASDGERIVTSGGGGGRDYGIEDQLDVYGFDAAERKLEPIVNSVAPSGVVDSITYCEATDLWSGCCKSECIIFHVDKTKGPVILQTFSSKTNETDKLPGNTFNESASERAPRKSTTVPRLIAVRFSPSGELLITGGEDRVLKIWRLNLDSTSDDTSVLKDSSKTDDNAVSSSNASASSLTSAFPFSETLTSRQTTALCKATNDCSLRKDQPVDYVATLEGHSGDVKDSHISWDSQIVATCSSDATFRLWDVKTGRHMHTQELLNPKKKTEKLLFRCCRFLQAPPGASRASQRLLTVACGIRGPSYLAGWEIQVTADDKVTCQKVVQQWIDATPCCAISVSSDNELFAIGFASGSCKVYDRRLTLRATHAEHDLPITGITFVNSNQDALSASVDYRVVALNLRRAPWSFCSILRRCVCLLLLLGVILACVFFLHESAVTGYVHYLERLTHIEEARRIIRELTVQKSDVAISKEDANNDAWPEEEEEAGAARNESGDDLVYDEDAGDFYDSDEYDVGYDSEVLKGVDTGGGGVDRLFWDEQHRRSGATTSHHPPRIPQSDSENDDYLDDEEPFESEKRSDAQQRWRGRVDGVTADNRAASGARAKVGEVSQKDTRNHQDAALRTTALGSDDEL